LTSELISDFRGGRPTVQRLLLGSRFAVLSGALLLAVGLAESLVHLPFLGATWLTAALGPTAYVILAHPRDATSRRRNGLVGHAVAVACGTGALALFGLLSAPSVAVTHAESGAQVAAQAVALGATLLVLEVVDAHHAPAAATALLVASGIAAPGAALAGLVVGLLVVLIVAPTLARLPGRRRDTADIDAAETPMG
jgi:hypothetical protein